MRLSYSNGNGTSNQNGPMTTTDFLGFLPAISAPSAVNPHAHSRPSPCRRHPAKWRPLITRHTGEGRYPEGRGLRMTRCQFDAQERMAYHVLVAETTPGRCQFDAQERMAYHVLVGNDSWSARPDQRNRVRQIEHEDEKYSPCKKTLKLSHHRILCLARIAETASKALPRRAKTERDKLRTTKT